VWFVYPNLKESAELSDLIVDSHSLGNNGPCLIPLKAFEIKENALKLNNGERWMGIIQLDSNLVRELTPCTLGLLESTNNIVE